MVNATENDSIVAEADTFFCASASAAFAFASSSVDFDVRCC